MNSLKLMQKVSNYLVVLFLWTKYKNINTFSSQEITNFLEENKNNEDVLNLLGGKNPNKFNRSSKTNINYITIFDEKNNTIPIECFELLKNIKLHFENKKFYFTFSSEEEKKLFNKWINVWSINKYIYDSDYGIVKGVIAKAEKLNLIRENNKDNKTKVKIIKNEKKGTKSVATKEYTYKEDNGDLITLFSNKYYIDFYDIYNKTLGEFFNEDICVKNILSKITMNEIINKLTEKNILIEKDKLIFQIKRNFY